jgi:hypothetical protein
MSSSNGVKASDRPESKVCDVSDCSAWKTGEIDYCHHHQGLAEGGASEGNQNAQKHGLYALPKHLKKHFTETQQDRYDAYFEALCTRYEHRLGEEPDAFAKDRLSRVAIECVKERIADEYFAEQAEGNLLVEKQIIDYDPETGPVSVEQSNKLLQELTALKRETRLTLKDMGLLHDPESQQANAQQEQAELVRKALRED